MKIRVALVAGSTVECNNHGWKAVDPLDEIPDEKTRAPGHIVRFLNEFYPTGDHPPDLPLEQVNLFIERGNFYATGARITAIIEEPLILAPGEIT